MTTWNYRLVRHKEPDGTLWYAIHEAYYDKDEVQSITEKPTRVISESQVGFEWILNQFRKALDKPILDYDAY